MREELKEISYEYEGETIFNLWKMLYALQDIYKVDFWDYYKSSDDFDNWCNSKNHGEIDPAGKERSASNIWYKAFEDDIENGLWKEVPHCSFIDMFLDDIEDLGNDESEDIYEVNLKEIMKYSIKKDKKEFGKNDYRVHLASILISEFGEYIKVDQK